jgi:hypothetical protein
MKPLLLAALLTLDMPCPGADWSLDPGSRLQGDDKEAWTLFSAGVETLQGIGDRNRAAESFGQVVAKFPKSHYAADSKELAASLREMVEEDKHWTEPKDPKTLPVEDKIAYFTYHLRDLNCYQISQPGMCYVLQEIRPEREKTNAAIKLKEIGEPAIPALIQLLKDRRPTRSVGYWRNFSPSRTVLRFQDAAVQILGELLPAAFYGPNSTSAYFSTEPPEVQERVIQSIKSWYEKSRGKSEIEKKWLAVEAKPGIYPLIALLRDLALEHGQKERVIDILHQMCKERDSLQLPQISELLCELGDRSKVEEVVKAYIAGDYDTGRGLEDDSAAGSNAQDSALRQAILYGTDIQRRALQKNADRKYDSLNKERDLFQMLLETTDETWHSVPKNYDRHQFPVCMLTEALTNKTEWTTVGNNTKSWTIRRCDAAAGAIQNVSKKDFGYNEEATEEDKDKAIGRIREWLSQKPR